MRCREVLHPGHWGKRATMGQYRGAAEASHPQLHAAVLSTPISRCDLPAAFTHTGCKKIFLVVTGRSPVSILPSVRTVVCCVRVRTDKRGYPLCVCMFLQRGVVHLLILRVILCSESWICWIRTTFLFGAQVLGQSVPHAMEHIVSASWPCGCEDAD